MTLGTLATVIFLGAAMMALVRGVRVLWFRLGTPYSATRLFVIAGSWLLVAVLMLLLREGESQLIRLTAAGTLLLASIVWFLIGHRSQRATST